MLNSQKQNPEVVRLVPQLPSLEPSGGEVSNSLLKKKKKPDWGISLAPLASVPWGVFISQLGGDSPMVPQGKHSCKRWETGQGAPRQQMASGAQALL